MYAMVNKIQISPVKCLVEFWQSTVQSNTSVQFTSLIVRLAKSMNLLSGSYPVVYISAPLSMISEENLKLVQMLRDDKGDLKNDLQWPYN